MEVGIPSGYYSDKHFIPEIDTNSCFEEVQTALWTWRNDPAIRHMFGYDMLEGMREANMPLPCHIADTAYQKYGLTYCR